MSRTKRRPARLPPHVHRFSAALETTRERAAQSFCLDDLLQIFCRNVGIERSGERRICKDKRISRFVAGMFLGERIFVTDIRVVDAVEHHIHTADPQHRIVKIETVEQLVVEMLRKGFVLKYFFMVVA